MSWAWFGRVLPALGILLTGCSPTADQTLDQPLLATGSVTAAAAGLPQPVVGDRLVYDRGASLRVTSIDGDLVTFRRGKSTVMVRSRNPFLPPVARDSARFEVRSEIDAPSDLLFPLAAGNTASFREERRSRNKTTGVVRTSTREWHCEVGDLTSVAVPFGTFDAWPVRCENPADDAFFRTARAYTWHYAPSIGQVVQERYERFKRAPRQRQLERVTSPAPLARGEVFEAVMQSSFETQPSGQQVNWRDDSTNQRGTLTIQRTLKQDDGTYCRIAEIEIVTGDTPLIQELTACRSNEGRWVALSA